MYLCNVMHIQDVYVVPFLLPMRSGAYEPPGEGSLSFDFHGMLSRHRGSKLSDMNKEHRSLETCVGQGL